MTQIVNLKLTQDPADPSAANEIYAKGNSDGEMVVALSSGSIQIDVSISGPGVFVNGTATVTPATITFSSKTNTLAIINFSTVNDLYISLDGGTVWGKFEAPSAEGFLFEQDSIMVKTLAGTAEYRVSYSVPSI